MKISKSFRLQSLVRGPHAARVPGPAARRTNLKAWPFGLRPIGYSLGESPRNYTRAECAPRDFPNFDAFALHGVPRFIAFVIILAIFAVTSARAEDDRLTAARQALNQGLPQVAVTKIRQVGEGWESPEDSRSAQSLLGCALFAAGRPAESIAVLEGLEAPTPEARLCLAGAQAELGQFDKALSLYDSLADETEFASRAEIGGAKMREELGQSEAARQRLRVFLDQHPEASDVALVLAALQVDAEDPAGALLSLKNLSSGDAPGAEAADYLRARAYLLSGRREEAETLLRKIAVPPANLAPAVAIALAESLETQEGEGEKVLEQFIETNPRLPGLETVFAALEANSPSPEDSLSELRKWSKDDGTPERAAVAQFYRARAEYGSGRTDKGMDLLEAFLGKYPKHPLTADVLKDLAKWKLIDGEPQEALAFSRQGEGPKLRFVEGEALTALQRHEEAAAVFLQAAQAPELANAALTNAALCAMLAGTPDSENSALAILATKEGGEAGQERIIFLEALRHAALREPDAFDRLQTIASGSSPWAPRARLALAEWNNLQLDREGARSELRKISNQDPDDKERIAYLEVFLSDSGEADAELQTITLATAFLKDFPHSRFEPDVRMKLGEGLHRRGDYLGSHREFTLVAEKFPDSPLAGPALFMAAQAKARSMSPAAKTDAIELYEQVARGDGALALRARLSQALLFNALKKPKEALGVLDNILTGQPNPELRGLVLIEMGDTHFAQGGQNPDEYEEAIGAWEKLASDPEASRAMRHQALVKMGAANEKLGQTDAALECYHQVFSAEQKGEPEYFWFYKAGFDAGRLLESQQLWKEAIVVYETIAASEGPRAGEARDRVNKLRLENFIWEK